MPRDRYVRKLLDEQAEQIIEFPGAVRQPPLKSELLDAEIWKVIGEERRKMAAEQRRRRTWLRIERAASRVAAAKVAISSLLRRVGAQRRHL